MATSIPEFELRGRLDAGTRRPVRVSRRRLLVVGAALALLASVANVLLAMALRSWLRVPAGFEPLAPPSVASLTVVGMIGATIVFAWIARTRPDPLHTFVLIAIAGLIVSWLPDLFIWVTGVFPGTTGAGILSLMTLHVVAAGCAVGILPQYGLRSE